MENVVRQADLPLIADITEAHLQEVNNLMTGTWQQSYNAVLYLRSVVKQFPQFSCDVISRYLQPLYQLLNNGKPMTVKNLITLLGQTFVLGQQINVQKLVQTFVALLIKKWSTQIGGLRDLINQCLKAFTENCGYECSFSIISQFCVDKNSALAQHAVKMLANLLGKLGPNIGRLSAQTLLVVFKNMQFLLEGKKQNMRNFAKQIFGFIYSQIGPHNLVSALTLTLGKEDCEEIMKVLHEKKTSKAKDFMPFSTARKVFRQSLAGKKQQEQRGQAFFECNS